MTRTRVALLACLPMFTSSGDQRQQTGARGRELWEVNGDLVRLTSEPNISFDSHEKIGCASTTSKAAAAAAATASISDGLTLNMKSHLCYADIPQSIASLSSMNLNLHDRANPTNSFRVQSPERLKSLKID